MRVIMVLPIALPLIAAALSLIAHRHMTVQRGIGLATLAATTVASAVLLIDVERNGITSVQVGGWPAPAGITLVADLFAAMMLLVSSITLLIVLVYAIAQRRTDEFAPTFHPVYLVLAAGVAMSFLSGDLFNLFVAFEVTLTASYVLITLGGGRAQIRSGMSYVVLNLLASTIFLSACGLAYAATGTVNMAQLSVRMAELPGGVREAIALTLLVAFGVKAAIFPLFNWLPDSYPTAPTPVSAVFAGLLTKVGVYAIIRTQTLFAPSDGASTLLLVIAALTMVTGVLGAMAQDDIKRLLSFHIVSQIGYMIMGLALFSVAGLAAAVFYVIHQIPVKTCLFLVDGIVETDTGTSSLNRLSGYARRAPVVGALFLAAALSLAGIPPLSGFVGKFALVEAGLAQGQWWIVAVSLVVSLITLYSMTKVWNGAFWGAPTSPASPERPDASAPTAGVQTATATAIATAERVRMVNARRGMVGATAALVCVTLSIALFARPIYDLASRSAEQLLDRDTYITAVLDR